MIHRDTAPSFDYVVGTAAEMTAGLEQFIDNLFHVAKDSTRLPRTGLRWRYEAIALRAHYN